MGGAIASRTEASCSLAGVCGHEGHGGDEDSHCPWQLALCGARGRALRVLAPWAAMLNHYLCAGRQKLILHVLEPQVPSQGVGTEVALLGFLSHLAWSLVLLATCHLVSASTPHPVSLCSQDLLTVAVPGDVILTNVT